MSSEKTEVLKQQLVPFIIIGIGCAVLDFGVTVSLTELSPLSRDLSKAVGWCVGTLVAYILNSRFAFQAEVNAKKAGAVFVLYASTFAVQLLIYRWAAVPLTALGFNKFFRDLFSFVIAQGVATVTNFVLQRRVIFREETKTKIVAESEPDVVTPKAPKGGGNPPVPPSAVASAS
ncbi:GtrA family protein [Corynebacterium sp. TA-R-1]|uniref:GtrA family protein n=1 Tax=Corynebacterium stercoris TaxID=2943490 RepID=A0ABT1G292_9CORY|nr:GtrA family protein [Corynebacterium stercoris]